MEKEIIVEEQDLFLEMENKEDIQESIKTVEEKIIENYKNIEPEEDFEENMTLEALNKMTDDEDDLKITDFILDKIFTFFVILP